jgi:hypothetical protein
MKSAKDQFEELGYEYSKVNEKIYWEQPAIFELGEPTPYVSFDLINQEWNTNIVEIEKDKKLIQAINKQVEELQWNK